MVIIDRYIARHVALSCLLVMGILVALFAIFSFLDELNRVGKGNYTTVRAIQYVALLLPGLVYQLMPITALLGSTIGLGILASNSELTIMRAAGVSLKRIIWSTMKIGLIMFLFTFVIGENIAPVAEKNARTLRSVAISDKLAVHGKSQLWAREGESFVNVRKILPGERLGGIYIYERGDSQQLSRIVRAESASFNGNQWVLENVVSSELIDNRVANSIREKLVWKTKLSPDLLNVVTLLPTSMSIYDLFQYISYLKKNGLDTGKYEHALWGKVAAPFITGVMVLLAIPFVFGPLRTVTIGHRILVGALAGIAFYLVNQVFSYMGVVFNFNPMLIALLPVLLVFAFAYWMLRRVH